VGRWRGLTTLTPDLSTMSWVISSDTTLGEIKVRVSRGVRGSPASKEFVGRTDTVNERGRKITNSNAASWSCGFAPLSHGWGETTLIISIRGANRPRLRHGKVASCLMDGTMAWYERRWTCWKGCLSDSFVCDPRGKQCRRTDGGSSFGRVASAFLAVGTSEG
jgi:hypothetical protein